MVFEKLNYHTLYFKDGKREIYIGRSLEYICSLYNLDIFSIVYTVKGINFDFTWNNLINEWRLNDTTILYKEDFKIYPSDIFFFIRNMIINSENRLKHTSIAIIFKDGSCLLLKLATKKYKTDWVVYWQLLFNGRHENCTVLTRNDQSKGIQVFGISDVDDAIRAFRERAMRLNPDLATEINNSIESICKYQDPLAIYVGAIDTNKAKLDLINRLNLLQTCLYNEFYFYI